MNDIGVEPGYEPMMAVVTLVELATSDLWGAHLRRSNFTTCEGILLTEEGRRVALEVMFEMQTTFCLHFLREPKRSLRLSGASKRPSVLTQLKQ